MKKLGQGPDPQAQVCCRARRPPTLRVGAFRRLPPGGAARTKVPGMTICAQTKTVAGKKSAAGTFHLGFLYLRPAMQLWMAAKWGAAEHERDTPGPWLGFTGGDGRTHRPCGSPL